MGVDALGFEVAADGVALMVEGQEDRVGLGGVLLSRSAALDDEGDQGTRYEGGGDGDDEAEEDAADDPLAGVAAADDCERDDEEGDGCVEGGTRCERGEDGRAEWIVGLARRWRR